MGSIHDWSSRLLFNAAGVALAAIVLLYIYEVTARYGFNAPTTWTGEAVQYSFATVIFMALPEVTRRASHVAIDIVPLLTKGKLRAAFDGLSYTLGGLACLVAGSIAGREAYRQFGQGIMTNAVHPIPRWWITAIITIGLISAGIHFIRHCFNPPTQQNMSQ